MRTARLIIYPDGAMLLAEKTDDIRTDDPKVPIHLLIYSVQTAITTLTCIADYMSWPEYTAADKMELGKLYVPYLALCKSSHLVLSDQTLCYSPVLFIWVNVTLYAMLIFL